MKPVQLFCWHFMAYPYLDKDFDEKEYTGWVTVPNRLWDNNKARGLYQEYIDQLIDRLRAARISILGISRHQATLEDAYLGIVAEVVN